MLRSILESKADGITLWTNQVIGDIVRVCREYGAKLQLNQVEAIGVDIFPGDVWQLVSNELRE